MSNNSNDSIGSSSPVAAVGIGLGALALGAAAVYTYNQRRSTTILHLPPPQNLAGVTVCLTGGNIGIGRAVALKLSERGATILIGCRNIEQGQQVCESINNTIMSNGSRNNTHFSCCFQLDLASPSSIESFSKNIQNHTSGGLHLLINNAGAMINEESKLTDDGYDRSMAVNHLGWTQLTQNLLPLLTKTKAGNPITNTEIRIVNVGSTLERTSPLITEGESWDDWMKNPYEPYGPFQAYSKAKLAMTAVTLEWAKESTIPMMLVSPGMVNTSLPRFMPLWKRVVSWPFRALLLRTPDQAADTVIFAATSADAVNGGYYNKNCTPIHNDPKSCSETARNSEVRKEIWEATKRAVEKRKEGSA
jgi:retinol dehydrogenase-12